MGTQECEVDATELLSSKDFMMSFWEVSAVNVYAVELDYDFTQRGQGPEQWRDAVCLFYNQFQHFLNGGDFDDMPTELPESTSD